MKVQKRCMQNFLSITIVSLMTEVILERDTEDRMRLVLHSVSHLSLIHILFASIIAADAVNGVNFHESVRKASTFIKKCILKAIEMDIPLTDGVPFEELLTTLK